MGADLIATVKNYRQPLKEKDDAVYEGRHFILNSTYHDTLLAGCLLHVQSEAQPNNTSFIAFNHEHLAVRVLIDHQ